MLVVIFSLSFSSVHQVYVYIKTQVVHHKYIQFMSKIMQENRKYTFIYITLEILNSKLSELLMLNGA